MKFDSFLLFFSHFLRTNSLTSLLIPSELVTLVYDFYRITLIFDIYDKESKYSKIENNPISGLQIVKNTSRKNEYIGILSSIPLSKYNKLLISLIEFGNKGFMSYGYMHKYPKNNQKIIDKKLYPIVDCFWKGSGHYYHCNGYFTQLEKGKCTFLTNSTGERNWGKYDEGDKVTLELDMKLKKVSFRKTNDIIIYTTQELDVTNTNYYAGIALNCRAEFELHISVC